MSDPPSTVSAAELGRLLAAPVGPGPAYAAIAGQVRRLLLEGRLALGARLPSERQLTAVLPVSRTTVTAAYEQLRAEGLLVSRRGSGSWLALPDGASGLTDLVAQGAADVIDLTRAAPSAPLGPLHAAMSDAVVALSAHLPGSGYELVGLPHLRAAIAERYRARGLPTDADQIMVTNGAQHGLALVLRALLDPGARVLVDSPTYPHALTAVAQAGGRAVPVPMPSSGWDLDALGAGLRQTAPSLAYLVPDFHNPTGGLLGEQDRQRVVDALRATRTVALADETLVDLRLDGPEVPPPLAAFDDEVISLGSMSKSCWAGLRIGWVRASRGVIERLVAVRPGVDLGTPVLEQLAATHLLHRLDEVVALHRAQIRPRRDAAQRLLAKTLPDWRWVPPHGGLSLWAELPVSSTALAAAAAREGLLLSPGTRFGSAPSLDRWLRLPYTQPIATLREAVRRLAVAMRNLPGSGPSQDSLTV